MFVIKKAMSKRRLGVQIYSIDKKITVDIAREQLTILGLK